ncbi:MAG: alanine racemase [Sneathiella sp.]
MPKISRRTAIIGGAAIVGAGAYLAKPSDKSGPRDPYFLKLQDAMGKAKISTPTLIVDKSRLNANIDTLVGQLPEGMGYRIVSKSLPSLKLIQHIRERSGTDRLMTFNLPMLLALSQEMPEASQLLGKPLPVGAADTYFKTLAPEASGAASQVQWLVDTPKRLKEYADLAQATNQTLKINLELDVGLHRGGMVAGEELGTALDMINASPYLKFAGFMGYEPHVPAIPSIFGWRDRVLQSAWKKYEDGLAQAASVFNPEVMAGITRNAAGSPTYRYYDTTKIANEISAGSCLVKPTHYDTELLSDHQAACFIATPVLKSFTKAQTAGLEFADGITRAWNPNAEKTIFTYGGNWMADPIDPPGLEYNPVFGRSSNQELINGGSKLDLDTDDYVFLRPQQSEALFLQFGDIAVYEDGAIIDSWPVFPASA